MKTGIARSTVDRILRRRAAERLACSSAAFRGRGIALLWHRIGPQGPHREECVRTVSTASFAEQLDILLQLGDVVPLAELETERRQRRPRFALTFDDDDPGHALYTLPVLIARDLPATFFLSGRWHQEQGPYWWEVLEARIRSKGPESVAAEYGLPTNTDAEELARRLTATPHAAELARAAAETPGDVMRAHHAEALVAAGMEVGFHTLDHPSLPNIDPASVRSAVSVGRDQLSESLGTPIVRFAYPHGRTNRSVTDSVRAEGYASAWTTTKRTVTDRDDRMERGRWDLGHLAPAVFRSTLVRGLVRPGR